MKNTTMTIVLKGHIFTAQVVTETHEGFVEYHISPNDEDLNALYSTQSIAVYPDRPYQCSITATDEDSKEYSRALITGLHSMLYRRPQ